MSFPIFALIALDGNYLEIFDCHHRVPYHWEIPNIIKILISGLLLRVPCHRGEGLQYRIAFLILGWVTVADIERVLGTKIV